MKIRIFGGIFHGKAIYVMHYKLLRNFSKTSTALQIYKFLFVLPYKFIDLISISLQTFKNKTCIALQVY